MSYEKNMKELAKLPTVIFLRFYCQFNDRHEKETKAYELIGEEMAHHGPSRSVRKYTLDYSEAKHLWIHSESVVSWGYDYLRWEKITVYTITFDERGWTVRKKTSRVF